MPLYSTLIVSYVKASQQSKAPKAPTATIALTSPSAKASTIHHHMAHSFLSAFSGCSARSALPGGRGNELSKGRREVVALFLSAGDRAGPLEGIESNAQGSEV